MLSTSHPVLKTVAYEPVDIIYHLCYNNLCYDSLNESLYLENGYIVTRDQINAN